MTESLLTVLLANDVSVPGVTSRQLDSLIAKPHVLRIQCDGCQRKVRIMPESLGIRVRCKKCEHIQLADWADVAEK